MPGWEKKTRKPVRFSADFTMANGDRIQITITPKNGSPSSILDQTADEKTSGRILVVAESK